MNFLLIRESELKLVNKLFLFEFFQGSAIAIYFTCSISIFLKHLPTTDLPKVFLLSSFLLWITGFIYNKLEHLLTTSQLIKTVISFNIICLLTIRFLMSHQNETWFLYIFLSLFNILYLLNNLDFWGLAAQLFDVRQSKRLFGIISAGDIPAKMIGYLSAYLISPYIGTENLLFVGAALLFVSFFIHKPLMRISNLESHSKRNKLHHASEDFSNIKTAIFGNKLIRKIALVSFFSYSCLIVINFVFYGYVKQAFKTDNSLVAFFSIFFFVIRAGTLILKIAGTNKLVDKLGLQKSLLISPIILIAIGIIIIYFSLYGNSSVILFYLYGVMAVVIDVLRSSIITPVLLATMQPLPVKSRLRGHTIVKGLMDPFAFFFMGLFLLFNGNSTLLDFEILSIGLFVLLIGWVFFSLSIEKDYLNTLQAAIRNRILNERDINLSDKESLNFLMKKIEVGNEDEAISSLKIISAQPIKSTIFLEKALQNPSSLVVNHAIDIIHSKNVISLLPQLKKLLTQTKQHSITSKLLKTITTFESSFDVSDYLFHPHHEVSFVAALSIISNESTNRATEIIRSFLNSEEDEKKLIALKIIAELKLSDFNSDIISLLNQQNEKLRNAAIIVAGNIATKDLLQNLFKLFKTVTYDNVIIDALEIAGDNSVPYIIEYLNEVNSNGVKARKLILSLGKIGSEKAISFLSHLLASNLENVDCVATALKNSVTINAENKIFFENQILEYLKSGIAILYKINFAHNNSLIKDALLLEIKNIRNICLELFMLLYNKDLMAKAKTGFKDNSKDSVANAIELIEMSSPKEISSLFAILFENSSITDKCSQLHDIFPQAHLNDSILYKNILFDINYKYSNWTKSCALFSYKEKIHFVNKEFLKPFTLSNNEVLKETAEYILHLKEETI